MERWALCVGALALAVCMAGGPAGVAVAGPTSPPPMPPAAASSPSVRFDLAVQPLGRALEQFGALTGLPVLFDAALVQGRTAAAVQGDLAPWDALHQLLAGTGLAAHPVQPGRTDAVVLRPVAGTAPAGGGAAVAGETVAAAAPRPVHRRYDGLLQTRVREAFCRDTLLALGHFRAAVQFGVEPDGRLGRVRLLDTSGDLGRDAAIVTALGQVRLDWPPPATLAQPITLVVQSGALCAPTR